MAFIPFPDGARAVIVVGSATLEWTNTLWFEDLNGPPADFQGLANYLHTWYGSNIMPYIDDSFQLKNVDVYDMSNVLGQVKTSVNAPVSGGYAGDAIPIHSALVVTFYSAARGRSGRGRNYISGLGEAGVSTTVVGDAAIVAGVEQGYDSLRQFVQQQTGFVWVVASQYSNGAPRTEVLPLQVERVSVRSAILGAQRRRIARP